MVGSTLDPEMAGHDAGLGRRHRHRRRRALRRDAAAAPRRWPSRSPRPAAPRPAPPRRGPRSPQPLRRAGGASRRASFADHHVAEVEREELFAEPERGAAVPQPGPLERTAPFGQPKFEHAAGQRAPAGEPSPEALRRLQAAVQNVPKAQPMVRPRPSPPPREAERHEPADDQQPDPQDDRPGRPRAGPRPRRTAEPEPRAAQHAASRPSRIPSANASTFRPSFDGRPTDGRGTSPPTHA